MFECIKKKFKKPVGYGEGDPVMDLDRYGFIIPHTRRSPGAVLATDGMSEYDYGIRMISSMDFPYATRDEAGIKGAVKELLIQNVNISIEPHFNSFSSSLANGYEILCLKGDRDSEEYAREFLEIFAEMFPDRKARRDNGVKWLSKGDRGYYNLKVAKDYGMKVALLPELFFGSNPKDIIPYKEQVLFWEACLIRKEEV